MAAESHNSNAAPSAPTSDSVGSPSECYKLLNETSSNAGCCMDCQAVAHAQSSSYSDSPSSAYCHTSATLRSNASTASSVLSYAASTSTCRACDHNSSVSCFEATANAIDGPDEAFEGDNMLRYSFKGFAPELYSPKKEFIYTRPLVEKQLVLKKTCEWWFYKNKCSNMSTHWKQNAFLILTTSILLLLGLIIFMCLPNGSRLKNATELIHPTRYQIDIPETQFVNHSIMDDVDWSAEADIETDFDDLNTNNTEEITSDYVKIIKVHNFSLNDDDLLYESKRKHNNNKKDYFSAFSVTGTFRSKSSQIWDPHPEYILNTFGRQLHLVLTQDTSFIPPKTFRVIRILNNRTEEEDTEEQGHYLGCYYKGHIQGDEQSTVAVSLCNGMTGYIKTSFGSLLIQPVNQTSDDTEMLHKVWRHSRRNARHAVAGSLDMDLEVLEQSIFNKLLRKKRNYVDRHVFTMEVMVAVDRTMIEFHKDNLQSYILTLISIVSNVFADASIGNSIHISLVNILILRDDMVRRGKNGKAGTSASKLLKHFCQFLAKQGYHYDTAMLITRDQICRNEREMQCDTLGLAELGTVCKRQSCAIVQDNGLPAAFTIAHELGHILNMPHDDDDRCKQFNKPGTKRKLHIMSSIMGDDIHPWSWSDCSRYYVSEFLEKEDNSCLEDTPTVYIPNLNPKQPGEIYSLDQQCQLILGNSSQYCTLGDECARLWCKAEDRNCRSSHLPWADGTPCGNGKNKWCQKGKCVPCEGNTRVVVNGGWGAWSAFTPCSLTCGGGVQESQRECDNPLPKNGGKYCTGSRKKYRSCNTQGCPSGSLDSREQQCYDMNGRNLGIRGIDRSALWIPKYGLSSKDKCKLYCRLEDNSAYFRLSEKVKDGTTCSFDSFDKCVNGICRPAGCDNELNSIAKLDKCGVCEGQNDTCEEHTGNFYVSDLYQIKPNDNTYYYYVTTIPKGASNIIITQPGYSDENYIVLRDDERNPLLNNNMLISTYRNISFYAGVTFEYNGSNSTVERVNTTYSRKLKRELIVEIISLSTKTNTMKRNDSILLTYSYTIDRPDYHWEMDAWSECDSMCQGNQHRLPYCTKTTIGRVRPHLCDETTKPATEFRSCNTDCQLSLNITSISKCSASCDMWGVREKLFNCIQTFHDVRHSNIVDIEKCKAKFQIDRFEQCRGACWNYTEWTQCSKSCGTGTQVRQMACFLNKILVNDSQCNPSTKPESQIVICNTEPCRNEIENTKISRSVPNHWSTSDWGECNDNCEKNRTVTCRSAQSYFCPYDKKPISKRKCCKIKYVTDWSKCSVDCGTGIRRKELHCARVYKPEIRGDQRRRVYIDPTYCRNLRRPALKEKPCKVSCKWSTSNWTQCPADCNDEYQSRTVYCESILGNQISYNYCNATKKPTAKKICNNCVKRESIIIKACNCEGYLRRRIICHDSHKHRIPCPTKEKIYREKCYPKGECVPQTCADLRRLYHYTKDREYTIYVGSKPTKIYCHNMNSKTPTEYITLNPTENYSIYYDYKTYNPDQCPPQSREREYRDNSISSGRTNFHRIRVNITTLRVIENDFTFAKTIGVPQPFGSAGDCYNRNMQCPQGDFSINLDHTGFRMRTGASWDRFGSSVVMQVSNGFETSPISRRAFCGGYCGRCSISPRTGLHLDTV